MSQRTRTEHLGNVAATGICITVLLLISCTAVETPTSRKSVTPTPTQWNEAGLRRAFASAASGASFVSIQDPVDWSPIQAKTNTQSKVQQDAHWQKVLLDQHRLGVFLQMDAFRPHFLVSKTSAGSLSGRSFADDEIRSTFKADALQRVELYQPRFFCLGMEINLYYEEFPDDFDHYVSLFKETYYEIKQIRPDTIVFVSFQYEHLLGLYDTGQDSSLPQWNLISRFDPEQDAVGISSYPMETFAPSHFGNPEDLPADYYARITQHTTKPIVFAELGWPSDPAFGGSTQKQAQFLNRFPTLIESMNIELVNWMFLYDIEGFGPVFDSMGMFNGWGGSKPSWNVWRALQIN